MEENERVLDSGMWVVARGNEAVYLCAWATPARCNQHTTSITELKAHIVCHLEDQILAGLLICGIVGCGLETASCEDLRRHLLFHLYHAELQARGMTLILGDPTLASTTHCGSTTPMAVLYPGTPLLCLWDDCHLFDETPVYTEHIKFHCKELSPSDRIDNAYYCRWEGCSYKTPSRRTLVAHSFCHSGGKKIACPFCGSAFCDYKTKITDHLCRKPNEKEIRLKCCLCQKTFQTQRLLREHSRRHVKHYRCTFCEMSVETPSDLRRHIRNRHSNEKPFECLLCNKRFHATQDLDRHAKSHLVVDSDLKCDLCDKTFKTKQWLESHRRRHEEPFAYACHHCPNKFGLGSLLGQHLRRVHDLTLPPGHSRFQFLKCPDGLMRLQTERYESEQIQEYEEDDAIALLQAPESGQEQGLYSLRDPNPLPELLLMESE